LRSLLQWFVPPCCRSHAVISGRPAAAAYTHSTLRNLGCTHTKHCGIAVRLGSHIIVPPRWSVWVCIACVPALVVTETCIQQYHPIDTA
jgi:hypothetical protein